MRTPKPLYAHERMIYQPELLTCPHCGDLLVTCNYLAWDKTVQRLDRVLSVASRPGRCPHATCVGSRLRLLSAAGQGIAPTGSTDGYDVSVRLGWWRQESRATYREIHADLASQVRISESHVGYLYQQVYLPLLACHERQHRDRLAQIATEQGGLLVALDGLAPQGGEPHIWFIRAPSSGVPLAGGWVWRREGAGPPFRSSALSPVACHCAVAGSASRSSPRSKPFWNRCSIWSGPCWPCLATSKRAWYRPCPRASPTVAISFVRPIICATWPNLSPRLMQPARGSCAKPCARRSATCSVRNPARRPVTQAS